ncbi:hypothetical protein AN189_15475 [Loktanella sp. 3ANDIMAR09]|uniref:DUF1127 domain-containing protein n=1 Tax=Loktanella sp. 3ANDIMAR09 TaxID=1225657 RepID=UPI0006F21A64|nr:DUF1127 domain-containing protein [Loktanella sp. 3ANDIMAR09]KQI67353.1 hypothetical protein AN189_15475 [Loktanella sp. 3ANDIMAR09]
MTTLTQRHLHAETPRPGLFARLIAADRAFRQRRAMHRLTDAQLRDIGLTRAQIAADTARPVWDSPRHWRT